jgi:hypothetical protein
VERSCGVSDVGLQPRSQLCVDCDLLYVLGLGKLLAAGPLRTWSVSCFPPLPASTIGTPTPSLTVGCAFQKNNGVLYVQASLGDVLCSHGFTLANFSALPMCGLPSDLFWYIPLASIATPFVKWYTVCMLQLLNFQSLRRNLK